MSGESLLRGKKGRPDVFLCPHCGCLLNQNGLTLKCEHGHAFDLAREGYVNLLLRPSGQFYQDKALFTARRRAYSAGFWDEVLNEIVSCSQDRQTVLDAGCGEGSVLKALSAKTAIGIDIAKPAAALTAKLLPDAAVCVGDLRRLPLADDSLDLIVNMLTPACYGEFKRVLHKTGKLIKIIPLQEHLIELRTITGKSAFGDLRENRLEILNKDFSLERKERIRYRYPCDEELAKAVYTMTPLTVHHRGEDNPLPDKITVDVEILVAHPHP